MVCEYAVIGKIINKSSYEDGLPIIDCSHTIESEIQVKQNIEKYFNIKNPDVKVWAFTHWS